MFNSHYMPQTVAHSVENSLIFLSLKFYVKLILGILEVQNLAFFVHLEAMKFNFYESLHFLKAEIDQIHKKHSEPQNWRNWQF